MLVSASNAGARRASGHLGNHRHLQNVGHCCCWKPDTALAAVGCYRTRRRRDSAPPERRLLRSLKPSSHCQPKLRGARNAARKAAELRREASCLAVACSLRGKGGAGLGSRGERRSALGCTGRAGVGKGGELPQRLATRCAAEGSVLSYKAY